ncbi:MAG: SLBB domain-containing protein [Anaerohalosphaeraceae bacterium]|nr:SLBB domain-containing protein [Anaerohalosphaeraceae bacterium]
MLAIIESIKLRRFLVLIAVFGAIMTFAGGCQEAVESSNGQISAFEKAGPISPEVDLDSLFSAKNNSGLYTVCSGDVLELQMPAVMAAFSPKLHDSPSDLIKPHLSRVSDSGMITLPIIGEISAAGKTLATIESEVVGLYYPKYLVLRPSVVCNVKEYRVENVTVVGAVVSPGVYKMRNNEMSLVNLLMKAGGIIEDGASLITIKNPKRQNINRAYITNDKNEIKQVPVYQPVPAESVRNEYISYTSTIAPAATYEPVEFVEPITIHEPVAAMPVNPIDYDSLEFDLVFSPAAGSSKEGMLKVNNGQQTVYSSYIDLTDSIARSGYIRSLETVIGAGQANIIGFALEQLASQMVGTMASSPVLTLSIEDDQLLDAADEYGDSDDSYKGCPTCDTHSSSNHYNYNNSSSYNSQYISQPGASTEVVFVEPEPTAYAPATNNAYIEPANMSLPSTVAGADNLNHIVLPIKGLNIPFADVAIMEGDVVEVKRLNEAVFTVMGLAKEPGAFPYPPDVKYNLMQAIGFAGGVDLIADPRFVSVYRQDSNGAIVSATFRIDKNFRQKSYGVSIKPGDVISIEVTPRTKMNVLLHQVLRINVGLYVKPGFGG